jgi:hypothetical protein
MAITASTISSTQTLEEFRLEFNILQSDVSTLESNPTYGASITFEGATADAYETTLTVVDPTADRTITLPNITGTVITTGDTGTVTVTMMAGGTDGNIISFDASGNPVAVATGSDGQILTSSGAGAVCAFEDAAAGGAGYFLGNSSGASGDTSTGLEDIFRVNSATVDNSCTIASATNASATGPLTVSSGVTVTVAGVLAVI